MTIIQEAARKAASFFLVIPEQYSYLCSNTKVLLLMIVYHGSPYLVSVPMFGEGNPHNDYGLGFYCTEDLELAKEWACPDGRDGFANQYRLDAEFLSISLIGWLFWSGTGFLKSPIL